MEGEFTRLNQIYGNHIIFLNKWWSKLGK
jgi:hypothetical protein